jgi:phosphotransferase system HPr (HPr) family protein
MPEITLRVHSKVGLHARPAALFVQAARPFESDIVVAHREREANAKSILGILTLGVEQGETITVRAEGTDAAQALAALQTLVEDNFGDAELGRPTSRDKQTAIDRQSDPGHVRGPV